MKYSEIIDIIKDKNVELRHDVDISMKSAFRMAEFEKSLGVKSIYYLRFDCDYYNLLTHDNSKIVDYLLNNHEIGCHVDCSYFETEDDLYNYLYFYNKIIPFKKFTFHINTEKTAKFGNVKYFENKSILFNEYISDSKNIFNQVKIEQLKKVDDCTLVIHPEWWDSEDFSFKTDGIQSTIYSLRIDEIKKQVLKEILKYE
jgi:hypothetical protein